MKTTGNAPFPKDVQGLLGTLEKINEVPLGIPAFWWGFAGGCIGMGTLYGCLLGPAAVGFIYFTTEDHDQTLRSFWGCLTGSVVGLVFFFVLQNFADAIDLSVLLY